ncbi:hypothetical protein SASPL_151401 [Salvia splendens]|uniref:non-specific serine/threonine protein kinase n=1 Tax=Salvia splendens TaxID=180675 RepID=A0A8X8W9B5_SALSN|nr:hypothetical protein SASPL_151401 [Salvia splendens]
MGNSGNRMGLSCGMWTFKSNYVKDQTQYVLFNRFLKPKQLFCLTGGLIVAALTSCLIALYVFIWRKRAKVKKEQEKDIKRFLKNNGNLAPMRYKYTNIKKMTSTFNENLGRGGFGNVYKGQFPNGHLVAVKVLNDSNGNGEDFMNEVASISRTSHVNIVTLLGFCFEGSKRALIYDFMPNGSLEKFIGKNDSSSQESGLGWSKLFEIALGIARGLEYLHQGCNTRILHLDIKPQNILLDKDMNPRISDFGLAKLCPNRSSIVSMMGTRGTVGYIAPEVFSRNFGEVSYKSDVYSYGMLVLEMVGGRKTVDRRDVDCTSEIYFPTYLYKQIEMNAERDGDLAGALDEEDESKHVKRNLIIVGLWCIQTNPKDRPSMTRVTEMLEGKVGSLEVPPKPYLNSAPRAAPTYSTSESLYTKFGPTLNRNAKTPTLEKISTSNSPSPIFITPYVDYTQSIAVSITKIHYYLNTDTKPGAPMNCCNGPNISFPFFLTYQQTYCGFPGFAINCSSSGFPLLHLSENELAMYGGNGNLGRAAGTCEESMAVRADLNEDERGDEVVDVAALLRRGFLMNWTAASDCSACQQSGGRCGFDETSYRFMCFCPDRPHSRSCTPENQLRKILLATLIPVIASLASSLIIILIFNRRKREKAEQDRDRDIELFLKDNGNLVPMRYKYSSTKKMTNSFRENLGRGGFGRVYKGQFPKGRLVAVKVLNESNENGEDFMNEAASISRTSHFIGNNASSSQESTLGWDKLFEIALGIARGLEYLHQGCNTRILHLDIKPQNILLDKDMNPRISDFGLAKMCSNRSSIVSMLVARGTIGYIAPEVFSRNFGEVSYKSDVYSYGMLVLDIARGKKTIDPREVDRTSETYFPNYLYKEVEVNAESDGNISVAMNEEFERQPLKRHMIIVGLWCIQTNPKD